MSENNEDYLELIVEKPVDIYVAPDQNGLQLQLRIAQSSRPGPHPRESGIRLEMSFDTASYLLAALKSAERYLDTSIRAELIPVPPARDRN